MLKENLLAGKSVGPDDGKLEKRDTFLGASLKFIAGVIIGSAVIYAVILIGAVWQYVNR